MILGCISHYGVGTITTVNGTINRHKYIEILEDNLWPLTIYRQCSILQLSAAIVFSALATRSRLRLSRVTVQAIRGNLYGSLPYSV